MKKNSFVFVLIFVVLLFYLNLVLAFNTSYGSVVEGDNYAFSRDRVDVSIKQGNIFRDFFRFDNSGNSKLDVSLVRSDSLSDVINLENTSVEISPKNSSFAYFLIKGFEIGNYTGYIDIKGDITYSVPVNISVVDFDATSIFFTDVNLLKKSFKTNQKIFFQVDINKVRKEILENVSFSYSLIDPQNKTYFLGSENLSINNSFQIIRDYDLPSGDLLLGEYILETNVVYSDESIVIQSPFLLKSPFFKIMVFGFIPMWLLFVLFGLIFGGLLSFYLIKKHNESLKKYKMKLDKNTIPKKQEGFLFLGKIAEKNIDAYLDPARLTTHCIVAGATGGGKSISAQVIIEEALLNNVSVIVFDPTAQWSGMLRKCVDKKMFAYYPKFGLKEGDAKGFKGNVRQVSNARELIDVSKYVNPGQIQIFSLNKLDPKDMDTFVANVIRQVFKSDPKESPDLKTLIVFDEVHRLLPKFGGSGEGFLQIERGCREFRKWGLGIMLVSQVLNDFVGEIKANISSEVQMRTRDEGDLKRIETKYGEEFLQSLVKASVGVGMFVNPAYNHAQPYFVNFRPILHSTRRLPDEELEKYNKYNDIVDDFEYQIEQLEAEKLDTFDLKMELKLVKDKIMSGSFSVVEIYLEGLKPRLEKEWEKLGKKPKPRKIKLVSEEEIQKSIDEAKAARAKIDAKEAAGKKDAEVKEKAKEKLDEKEVAPITFDNGMMIGSIKELRSVLPTLDEEIFKIHVNSEKNDIADWVTRVFSEEEGAKLKKVKTKDDLLKALESFGKPVTKDVSKKKVGGKEGGEEKKAVEEEGGKENKDGGKEEGKEKKAVEEERGEEKKVGGKDEKEDGKEKKDVKKDEKVVDKKKGSNLVKIEGKKVESSKAGEKKEVKK